MSGLMRPIRIDTYQEMPQFVPEAVVRHTLAAVADRIDSPCDQFEMQGKQVFWIAKGRRALDYMHKDSGFCVSNFYPGPAFGGSDLPIKQFEQFLACLRKITPLWEGALGKDGILRLQID